MRRQYRANDRRSMELLAQNLATTPSEAVPKVLGALLYHRMMRPAARGLGGRLLGLGLALVRLRHGLGGAIAFVTRVQKRNRDLVALWMADALHHCLLGHDTEDTDSVGGWSQREVDLLTSTVQFSRDADEEALAAELYAEHVRGRARIPRLPNWDDLPYEACEPFLNRAALEMAIKWQEKLRREQASAHV